MSLLTQTDKLKQEHDIFQLTLAAESGNIELLKQLLSNGVYINSKDKGGCTALYWAVYGGQLEIVQYLHSKCGSFYSAEDMCQLVVIGLKRNNFEIAQHLMNNDRKFSILEVCFRYWRCHPRYFIKLLNVAVSLGFNVNETDANGDTLLSLVVHNHDPLGIANHLTPSWVKHLLHLGANKNNKNKRGLNALMITQGYSFNGEIIKLLE